MKTTLLTPRPDGVIKVKGNIFSEMNLWLSQEIDSMVSPKDIPDGSNIILTEKNSR